MSCQLYLLTPPRIAPGFADVLAQVLDTGAVSALQIRLKDHSPDEIRRLAPELVRTAQKRGVAAILNDDPYLAAELGADGVHIGQTDGTYKDARSTVGPNRIVGVTCHDSRHLAMQAGERGADYVAFGAFFETATKSPKARADIALLEWWSEIFEIPCVAIGGITVENARPLIEAGADFLAVSGGVWTYRDGPVAAVKAFADLMKAE
ncbi:thiamine phosphate synthase [Hyphobacterium marinum]|uniref:Thiamine-phosphate synthase n=1 Tax=Hyphobacterium marinum TaxID=3116574 RepID=A0ABU7LYC9_9PROT|nr:thiamine phosphate synthase [Hyphobacterium sp. Y6023]MEE2566563.1 thiamine phosphate synthase [Hyphobacterium sp. Y6023]